MLKKKYEVAYMYKNKKVCIKRVISNGVPLQHRKYCVLVIFGGCKLISSFTSGTFSHST